MVRLADLSVIIFVLHFVKCAFIEKEDRVVQLGEYIFVQTFNILAHTQPAIGAHWARSLMTNITLVYTVKPISYHYLKYSWLYAFSHFAAIVFGWSIFF